MPEEPVPMTATRLPVKSTPSWGQRLVKYSSPANSIDALDVGFLGYRQAARGHHDEAAADVFATVGADVPDRRRVLEAGLLDAGAEHDVAAQVELVGDVVQVAAGSPVGWRTSPTTASRRANPGRSCTCSRRWGCPRAHRVAVPVPGAADVVAGLEGAHRETQRRAVGTPRTARRTPRRRPRRRRLNVCVIDTPRSAPSMARRRVISARFGAVSAAIGSRRNPTCVRAVR